MTKYRYASLVGDVGLCCRELLHEIARDFCKSHLYSWLTRKKTKLIAKNKNYCNKFGQIDLKTRALFHFSRPIGGSSLWQPSQVVGDCKQDMPGMGFGQALVAKGFSAEPALLATKRAFHHKTHFADRRVTGKLAWAERLVLEGLVLNAVLESPFLQGLPIQYLPCR